MLLALSAPAIGTVGQLLLKHLMMGVGPRCISKRLVAVADRSAACLQSTISFGRWALRYGIRDLVDRAFQAGFELRVPDIGAVLLASAVAFLVDIRRAYITDAMVRNCNHLFRSGRGRIFALAAQTNESCVPNAVYREAEIDERGSHPYLCGQAFRLTERVEVYFMSQPPVAFGGVPDSH